MQQAQSYGNFDRGTNDILHAFETQADVFSRNLQTYTDRLDRRHDQRGLFREQHANNVAKTTSIAPKHPANLSEEELIKAEAVLLDSLRYPSMDVREDAIAEAHAKTFEQVFQDTHLGPWDSFTNWLRYNDGIYWVSGKAASGKSTLMKFLCSDQRVDNALSSWSGQTLFLLARHFLSNLRPSVPKSQAGLLLSLLGQTLSQYPTLIPIVMPETWERVSTDIRRDHGLLVRSNY